MQKETPMSTDEENINTASIEEMINANLGIDAAELEENSPEEPTETDPVIAAEALQETSEAMPDDPAVTDEENAVSSKILEQTEAATAEIEDPVETNDATDLDLNSPSSEDNSQAIEEDVSDITENIEQEPTPIDAEENSVELNEEQPETKILSDEITPAAEETPTEKVSRQEDSDNADPMLALESEVSELENEIQEQLDQFVEQADHLKSNIQSELQRVSSDNEKLQEQITSLVQQLSGAEEKIQGFSEVQDKQQATIHKLILIIKGIRTKISRLYEE
jgi:chromosome segregation ATPase